MAQLLCSDHRHAAGEPAIPADRQSATGGYAGADPWQPRTLVRRAGPPLRQRLHLRGARLLRDPSAGLELECQLPVRWPRWDRLLDRPWPELAVPREAVSGSEWQPQLGAVGTGCAGARRLRLRDRQQSRVQRRMAGAGTQPPEHPRHDRSGTLAMGLGPEVGPGKAADCVVELVRASARDRLLAGAHHLSADVLRRPAAPLPADVHLLVRGHAAGDLAQRL